MAFIKKFLKILLLLSLIGAIIFGGIQIYVNSFAKGRLVSPATAPSVDAVMILGAYVYENGNPSPVLQDRLDYGYQIYQAGKAKKIIVTGDHGTIQYDEVNAMKDYLLKKGVPPQDIFLDHAGFDTYDSMYRARDIFGVKSLIISTQQFHINRALYISQRLGLDSYGYPSDDNILPRIQLQNARESLAKVKAVLETDILRNKPRLLGPKIPISGDGRVTFDKD